MRTRNGMRHNSVAFVVKKLEVPEVATIDQMNAVYLI